jgi:sortase B
MARGKYDWQTPAARKHPRKRPVLVIMLLLGLTVGLAALSVYFVQSAQNRATQADMAALHQDGLQVERTQAYGIQNPPVATAIAPAATDTPIKPVSTREPFFQAIGLTRKAFKPIVARNADAVGWIGIEGLVDQPIVYRDNTYYLNHDFDGHSNACGAIFLDEGHPLRADAQHLLLYGHNMKDGTMFGKLSKYTEGNFLRTHYRVTLETRFQTFTYLIFAVCRVSMDPQSARFLYFWGYPSFDDDKVFDAFIDDAYRLSLYTRFLDVKPSDALLTMVTCIGEERLVLFARKERSTDTQATLQTALLTLTIR